MFLWLSQLCRHTKLTWGGWDKKTTNSTITNRTCVMFFSLLVRKVSSYFHPWMQKTWHWQWELSASTPEKRNHTFEHLFLCGIVTKAGSAYVRDRGRESSSSTRQAPIEKSLFWFGERKNCITDSVCTDNIIISSVPRAAPITYIL